MSSLATLQLIAGAALVGLLAVSALCVHYVMQNGRLQRALQEQRGYVPTAQTDSVSMPIAVLDRLNLELKLWIVSAHQAKSIPQRDAMLGILCFLWDHGCYTRRALEIPPYLAGIIVVFAGVNQGARSGVTLSPWKQIVLAIAKGQEPPWHLIEWV